MSLLVLVLSWGSMGLEAATAVVSAGGQAPGPLGDSGLDYWIPGQILRGRAWGQDHTF